MKLKYLKKAISATGRELFIFVMEKNWSLAYHQLSPSSDVQQLETYLENLAKDHWYYGGNMHIDKDNQNHGIVLTDPTAATYLMMSDYCIEK